METQPLLLDKKTSANLLAISLRKLDYLIASGELKPRRIGRRVLLSYKQLQKFAAKGN